MVFYFLVVHRWLGCQFGRNAAHAFEHRGRLDNLFPAAVYGLRHNGVLGVVRLLLVAAAIGLVDGPLHRIGDAVGVEDHHAGDVAGRAANRLDQCDLRAQEALLASIEHGHQRDLGQIQAFAQQIDPHQHVKFPQAQIAEDLDAVQRLNIRMQVAHPDVELFKVVGEIFGHALGHSRDQDPLLPFGPLPYFFDEVVDLPLLGTHLNGGIDQSCRPNHLLDHHTARLL